MTRDKQAMAVLIRQFAELVEGLEEVDIDEILRRQLKLKLVSEHTAKRGSRYEKRGGGESVTTAEMKEKLSVLVTREAAESYLDSVAPRKVDLITLARYLKIPIHNSDTVERLRDKIVDSTVGFRLRSHAIRGDKQFE